MIGDSNENGMYGPIPPTLFVLASILATVELVNLAGSAELTGIAGEQLWRRASLTFLGFWGSNFLAGLIGGDLSWIRMLSLVTYSFVHYSTFDAIISIVFLVGVGRLVAFVLNDKAALFAYFAAAVLGALAYSLFDKGGSPLAGGTVGFNGILGLMWALLVFNATRSGTRNRSLFLFPIVLLVLQVSTGLLLSPTNVWLATLVGFIVGFLTLPLAVPESGRVLVKGILEWLAR